MKRTLLLAATLLTAFGCSSAVDAFRNGIPSKKVVTLDVPGASSSLSAGGLQHTSSAVEGQTSDFYVLTRSATVIINGGTAAWLDTLQSIAANPPSSTSGNTMTWGPGTNPLSPVTYKLVVTQTGTDSFTYSLDGKPKTADDSAYVALVSGNHTVTGQDFGSGSFHIDWNAAQTLPQHDDNVGTADISYSRDINTSVATVDAVFTQVKDGNTGNLIDAQYAFTSSPGVFQFQSDGTDDQSNPVRWSVESRWNTDGTGRADAQGVDGAITAHANECWDANFISRYEAVDYNTDPSDNYGTLASDCPADFQTAQYSNLQ